jgi:glycosyltransferase involved in cell wall biosynthesis
MTSYPLRVMIDARMLLGRFSGVSRFVTRLVDALVRQDGLSVTLLCGNEPPSFPDDRDKVTVVSSSFTRSHRRAHRRLLWEQRHLPRLIRRAGVHVYHATWNTGVPLRCPVPALLTVHDLMPWHAPAAHLALRRDRWCYRYAMKSSARHATRITTVSECVRRQVIRTLGCAAGKTVTVPNGVDLPVTDVLRPQSNAPPYVLYVGGHQPRKNLEGVFRALRSYWDCHDASMELRLTGTPETMSFAAAAAYRHLGGGLRVRFAGQPDDAHLAGLYAAARCLLMLSRDEGFGLPALEAMAYGCPVIAADRASLPEVVGDAGILVDPDDTEGVVRAIHRLNLDPAFRAEHVERGRRRARRFQWAQVAEQVRDLYEALAARRKGAGRVSSLQVPAP